MIKTENLVILFTDIAGFTEATTLHSREQNKRILEKHNAILLPIVKRFHGRHIKSVGDALLLVFTSPTDAMRCAMAMQDALHAYNLTAPPGEDIHIRIAASLGEVRVSKGDIFGEPVNVTSRIEAITPGNEIYFSEAVYLAMNKAEVPAVEIGLQELKGIPKPVRIFAVPRFANTRLVPDTDASNDDNPELSFPFGGMHLSATPVAETWMNRVQKARADTLPKAKSISLGVAAAIIAFGILCLFQYTSLLSPRDSTASNISEAPTPTVVAAISTPTTAPVVTPTIVATQTIAATPTISSPPTQPPAPTPAAQQNAQRPQRSSSAAAIAPPPPQRQTITNIRQAKQAYRDGKITKDRYREIVRGLEEELDLNIRRAKADYRDGRMTKEQYKYRVRGLKLRYEGE